MVNTVVYLLLINILPGIKPYHLCWGLMAFTSTPFLTAQGGGGRQLQRHRADQLCVFSLKKCRLLLKTNWARENEKTRLNCVVLLRLCKTNGMSAPIRSAWLMTLGQTEKLYRKHCHCAFTAAFKIYFLGAYKEHAGFNNLNWKLLEGKMIVCHWQGGASSGGDRKEAVTGRRVGTYRGKWLPPLGENRGGGWEDRTCNVIHT